MAGTPFAIDRELLRKGQDKNDHIIIVLSVFSCVLIPFSFPKNLNDLFDLMNLYSSGDLQSWALRTSV